MKILQQNICWKNDNLVDMMNVLLKEEPDILLFSEFAPQKHRKPITEYLKKLITKSLCLKHGTHVSCLVRGGIRVSA